MLYLTTRDRFDTFTAFHAIKHDAAPNGGRFVPFKIDKQQLDSVHGIDENVDISTLAPAVDFYKYVIKEV